MMWQALGIFVSLLLVACDSESPDNGEGGASGTAGSGGNQGGDAAAGSSGSKQGGSGGKAGTGAGGSSAGSSGGGAAGSDPGTRGAVSLNLLAPAGCSLTPHYEEFPSMASGHAVTATEKGPGIQHGDQSDGGPAVVFCRRIGANAPYKIAASITTGQGGTRRVVSFNTPTMVGVATAGSVVVQLPVDQNYMGECMFTPIEVGDTAHSIWGGFSCDSFVPFQGDDPCALGESYFFFENCE